MIKMNGELKKFNINLEDIKESNELFNNINQAIKKMEEYNLKNRFEVILNNNLIEFKEKLTNYITILGCKISYDNLDSDISFILREDNKPTYEELEQKLEKQNNFIEKIKELIE